MKIIVAWYKEGTHSNPYAAAWMPRNGTNFDVKQAAAHYDKENVSYFIYVFQETMEHESACCKAQKQAAIDLYAAGSGGNVVADKYRVV